MLKSFLGNLFSFDKMISEQIIKLVYYIGLIGIALGLIGNLYLSITSGFGNFLPLLVKSLIGVVIGVLLWRVLCEVIILIFRIYSRLGDINKALGGKNTEKAIPGDDVLQEVREAALKAKAAATEKAKGLKSSISKDTDDVDLEELRPAAATLVKKPTVKKATTSAKKTTTSAAKKTTAAAKKTSAAAKKTASTVKKTTTRKTTTAKKTTPKK